VGPLAGMDARRVGTPTVTQTGTNLTVQLSYDGTRDALLNLGWIPLPSRTIRRGATVRLAGL
jgi:hypothetical protein